MSDLNPFIRVHSDLSKISASAWNALIAESNPFGEYDFLRNLELSGSVGKNTGWDPQYFTYEKEGKLLGAIAFYLKNNSYGEFVFDFEWARLYAHEGAAYYPKGVVAIPYTPANGERIFLHPEAGEEVRESLIVALLVFAEERQLSSVHFLFLKKDECKILKKQGFLKRTHYQFHWENKGYQSFHDYLKALQHKHKNQILRERRRVEALGFKIEILQGDNIKPEHLEAIWHLSARTFIQKSGDVPYLTESFFQKIAENFRQNTVLVMAHNGQEWVAGSINFKKGKHLYGRYWGSLGNYPFLHFECCFYRLIEFAIENKIELFEAGAQGEQKFFRGFATRPTYSMHWIRDPGFAGMIAHFLKEESKFVERLIENYNTASPLKYLRGNQNKFPSQLY